MPNALASSTPPAAPEVDAAPPPQGNALRSNAPAQQGPAQQQQAPQLSHEQMVAALRHFDAIRKELETIAANPALGKSSVKDSIISGVTRLVAERFMKPADAVDQLTKVPSDPLLQMKWVKGLLAQTMQTENALLDHFGASQPHVGTVADHFAASKPGNPDDHLDHMGAVSSMFKGPANA